MSVMILRRRIRMIRSKWPEWVGELIVFCYYPRQNPQFLSTSSDGFKSPRLLECCGQVCNLGNAFVMFLSMPSSTSNFCRGRAFLCWTV